MSITPTKTVHHFNDKPNVKVSFCGLGLVWPPSQKTKEEIPLLFACFSSGQSPKMESTPKSRANTNKNRTNRQRVLSALEENNMTAESWSGPELRRGYKLKSTYYLTSLAYSTLIGQWTRLFPFKENKLQIRAKRPFPLFKV